MSRSARRIVRCGLLAFFLSALLVATAWASEAPTSLLGQRAPILSGRAAFSPGLINLQQLQHQLVYERESNGRNTPGRARIRVRVVRNVVVLNFFATYCVPCVHEIPVFNRIAQSYKGRPVKFVYVNVDTEKPANVVRDFAKAKGIQVEMILPSVRYVMQAYKVKALPRLVVVDRNGKVAYDVTGAQKDLSGQLSEVLAKLLPPAAAKTG